MSFLIEGGLYGPRFVLQAEWKPEYRKEIEEQRVRELELNYAKGWKGNDLSFLKGLPGLLALEITNWNIEDVSGIHEIPTLKRLKISTYCKTEIAFDQFPELEDVSLEWRPKAKSLLKSQSVEKVFVNKYPGKDLSPFVPMARLRSLALASPKLQKLGSAVPVALEFLGIYRARRLAGLDGIEAISGLRRVEINDCARIGSIHTLPGLKSLEVLHLCDDGELETLRPIAALSRLRELLFYGNTDISDGLLSVLDDLHLEKIVFQERSHYDRCQADFRR